MGGTFARYVHACICTLYIEHVAWLFRQIIRDTRAYGTTEPESWLKLLVRIREGSRSSTSPSSLQVLSSALSSLRYLGLRYLGACPGVSTFHSNSWELALAQNTTALAIDNQELSQSSHNLL